METCSVVDPSSQGQVDFLCHLIYQAWNTPPMPYNGVTESIGLVPLGLPWSWSLVRKAHDTAPPSSRQPSSISIHRLACAVLSAVRLIGAVIEWPELMLADRSLCSNSPLLCLSHQESVSSVSSTRLTAFQPPLRAPGSLQMPLDHQSNQITAILTACWLVFSGYCLRRFLWLVFLSSSVSLMFSRFVLCPQRETVNCFFMSRFSVSLPLQ